MKKKLLAFAIVGILAFSLSACGSEPEPKEEVKKEEQKKEEPKAEAKKEEHFEIDLTGGNYTAGKDIPVGTYNLTATGGNGNVHSSNAFDGGINEVMGTPADEYTLETFNGVSLKDGDILSLSGTVTLHLVSENALVSSMVPRGAADGSPVDLVAGNYTAGTDFPAGYYNIVATGNSGNVASMGDSLDEEYVNEIMGVEEDGYTTHQFNNAHFSEGTQLQLGTSVQLVPVGE